MERRVVLLALLAFGFLMGHAHATWKPEYAQNSPEVREWYDSQTINEEARKRMHVDWHSCCKNGDVFRTQFRVSGEGDDEWFYLKDGVWKQVPPDIIKWGEHTPDGKPTLFIYQATGQELCFWPPEEGI